MPTTTFTVTTDIILKQEAQSYFESLGLTLESGLTNYLQLIVNQANNKPLILQEVVEKTLPPVALKALEEFKSTQPQDFIVFPRKGQGK